jgi:predicted nucleic acid-binding protein
MAEETEAVSAARRLVLDANILLRGVFGTRVRTLLETYEDNVDFYVPDVCFADAQKYITEIAQRRGVDPAACIPVLDGIARIVTIIDRSLYEEYETVARARIALRDEADWPVIAAALLLDAPVWTEDQDFFGSGTATWTTSNVDLYLRDA